MPILVIIIIKITISIIIWASVALSECDTHK